LRPTYNYKRKEKFDRINYEMFKHVDLEMPERLSHLVKKKKKRQFALLYKSNRAKEEEEKSQLEGSEMKEASTTTLPAIV
jgi:hypothetical protein